MLIPWVNLNNNSKFQEITVPNIPKIIGVFRITGAKGPRITAANVIRKGDWKLIYYHLNERFELFNINNDIGETTNLTSVKKN